MSNWYEPSNSLFSESVSIKLFAYLLQSCEAGLVIILFDAQTGEDVGSWLTSRPDTCVYEPVEISDFVCVFAIICLNKMQQNPFRESSARARNLKIKVSYYG